MGIFSKKVPPPTSTDLVEEDAAMHEKNMPSQLENAHPQPHIDPEMEKRVVRKLDWRVPPLVATLCEELDALIDLVLISTSRSARVP
jgi:hypothetical protein